MNNATYDSVNKAWKGTCKSIFGEEIGELKEYEAYLREGLIGKPVKSHFSGKELWVVSTAHHKNAKFFDYEKERSHAEKTLSKPTNINDIKDIDSLLNAVKEKALYSGNTVLGNSKNVEYSDTIVDSMSILNSSMIIGNKYVAYAYLSQYTECSFGSTSSGQSAHIIRCFYNNSIKRCFECSTSVALSDSYFSYNCLNSTDCMFSFNLRGKQYMIANVQLEKQQYADLKKKLLVEITEKLKGKKRFDFSIIDIVNGWEYA